MIKRPLISFGDQICATGTTLLMMTKLMTQIWLRKNDNETSVRVNDVSLTNIIYFVNMYYMHSIRTYYVCTSYSSLQTLPWCQRYACRIFTHAAPILFVKLNGMAPSCTHLCGLDTFIVCTSVFYFLTLSQLIKNVP